MLNFTIAFLEVVTKVEKLLGQPLIEFYGLKNFS